jgi:hypothetical protein
MSSDPETARILRSWLDEGVTQLPDRVLDRVLDEIETTPQLGRERSVSLAMAVAGVAAAIVLAAVVAAGILTIPRGVADAPPDASREPQLRSPLDRGTLEAGTHTVEGVLGLDLTFTVPDGWAVGDFGDGLEIETVPADRPADRLAVGFFDVDNLFADPCATDDRTIDPPIGPTVDDLANGFSRVAGYGASVPVATSLDGHRGLSVDLELVFFFCPLDDAHLWTTAAGEVHSARGASGWTRLWILDVAGDRLVIEAYSGSGTASDRAELEAIVESIRITP